MVEKVASELFDKMQRSWFLLDIYPCGILLPNLLNFSVTMLLIARNSAFNFGCNVSAH